MSKYIPTAAETAELLALHSHSTRVLHFDQVTDPMPVDTFPDVDATGAKFFAITLEDDGGESFYEYEIVVTRRRVERYFEKLKELRLRAGSMPMASM